MMHLEIEDLIFTRILYKLKLDHDESQKFQNSRKHNWSQYTRLDNSPSPCCCPDSLGRSKEEKLVRFILLLSPVASKVHYASITEGSTMRVLHKRAPCEYYAREHRTMRT